MVELTIVLVIVGLLLGGILKGQELVTQAKVKNAIADFSGTSAAYHGYRDRYRALPGDDAAAGRWAGATPGDGDGMVEGAYNAPSATPEPESRLWWEHLRRAGFIEGSINARQPVNFRHGVIGVQTGDGAGGATLAGLTRLMVCSTGLPDRVAAAMDVQMDDGDGTAGEVRALAQSTANPTIDNTSAPAAYVETGANLYALCRELL